MPANLTPDYLAAEREFKQAREPDERLAALRKMLATLPKHKGTEKIQADLRKRIAKLADEIQSQGRKRGFSVKVEREGAGQIAVVGPPNHGKSSLVATLTGVDLPVAPHPYTTQAATPAMMPYLDVRVQIVDLPPISSAHVESWVPQIVRAADVVLAVADLSAPDVIEALEDCLGALEERKVRLVGGDPAPDPWASVAEKRALLAGTKLDAAPARDAAAVVRERYAARIPFLAVSTVSLENVEELRRALFGMLRVIRVYSKPPHHPPDLDKPFVVPEGSTVLEFAATVHKDFAERFQFARVWGHAAFDGQRVTKEHRLADGDVVELHA